jgi:disulfide bond formation protein DsbB
MPFNFRGPRPASIFFNVTGLLAISGVLLFAFAWQFRYDELPCPLCLLQRVAFILAGAGMLLNLRFGPSPAHYALVIGGALGGVVAAGRQVLLHMAPGDPGYGGPVFGLHFYTWALLAFAAMIAWAAFMLVLDRKATDNAMPRRAGFFAGLAMWLFFLVSLGNTVSTTLECGLGPCPDNPTGYLWWPGATASASAPAQ